MKYTVTALFFVFICWIIYTANVGEYNPLIDFVYAVPYRDKWGHFVLFGIMAALGYDASGFKAIKLNNGFSIPIAPTAVLAFALVEEFTQLGIPNREFDFLDMACDVAGITLFSLFAFYRKRLFGNRLKV